MKHLLAAALLAVAIVPASAERADSLKQAIIKYDSLDVDEVTRTRILTGNVELTRGTLVLRSDKALLKETPEGYMSVTLTADGGKAATFRQKRDGGADLWVEGRAQRIEYDERAELVKLFSNAQVKELDGGRMTHEVNGEYISYDNRKEIAAVRNDVSGQTKPGKGQGVMILAPSRGAAPAPAAGK